ncbi:acetoin utilization deacetylase AcuC-like enzyme [Pseudomonas protegens]|nr:acetoin utilization deacetylase AcuC-like enzyme [Pseudomonas protegens]NAN55041.1 histone deacetylase family protein [Pseudomonas protegens]NUE77081.1 histone deacetylase family protein [Pseudomonas protegens]ROM30805.1 acetylpolyamine amidohydrolase [Pseudomonas protegens]ROQ57919.1 acetoin utilization deacetylase AcuC-like enzyme [Pseudomonas protegens]
MDAFSMLTVFSESHRLHHGTELKDGVLKPSFEQPSRADTVRDRVRHVGLGEIIGPRRFDRACYVAAHSERYVSFLENAWSEWTATGRSHDALPLVWPVRDLANQQVPEFIDGKLGFFAMDAGSPITATTWDAVRTSADIALTALALIDEGQASAFALCRPPGHHAAREYMGGYCYLNNAAIAAQHAITRGARRVAVLDVDFHHGNGTQNIFYDRGDVLFVSLHGDPAVSYPYFSGHASERGSGAGEGCNLNLPLPKNTTWQHYRQALELACKQLRAFAPELLVVSLGVDTFKDDPISHFLLESEDFLGMGQIIATVGTPTLFVMEGGYMVDEIGLNAVNVLHGHANR